MPGDGRGAPRWAAGNNRATASASRASTTDILVGAALPVLLAAPAAGVLVGQALRLGRSRAASSTRIPGARSACARLKRTTTADSRLARLARRLSAALLGGQEDQMAQVRAVHGQGTRGPP